MGCATTARVTLNRRISTGETLASTPGYGARLVGVETVNHSTDPQLATFARRYLHAVDRMEGLVPWTVTMASGLQ
jgi:hypothetical protein